MRETPNYEKLKVKKAASRLTSSDFSRKRKLLLKVSFKISCLKSKTKSPSLSKL